MVYTLNGVLFLFEKYLFLKAYLENLKYLGYILKHLDQ